jgi:hypothetical protein
LHASSGFCASDFRCNGVVAWMDGVEIRSDENSGVFAGVLFVAGDFFSVEKIRLDFDRAEPGGAADLEFDMIPDAGGSAVLAEGGITVAAGFAVPMREDAFDEALVLGPDAVGFFQWSVYGDAETIASRAKPARDIELESLKITFVFADSSAIDFCGHEVIDAVKDEKGAILWSEAVGEIEFTLEFHATVEIGEAVQVPVGRNGHGTSGGQVCGVFSDGTVRLQGGTCQGLIVPSSIEGERGRMSRLLSRKGDGRDEQEYSEVADTIHRTVQVRPRIKRCWEWSEFLKL